MADSQYRSELQDLRTELEVLQSVVSGREKTESTGDAALRSRTDQTFARGICMGCDEPIDESRLTEHPDTELCLECASPLN